MEKLIIPYPIVVEGKYDKIKLDSIIQGSIITTGGFSVFSDKEKKAFFLALSKKTKIIIATDSDGGGLVIRNYFKSLLPKDRIIHIYIPDVKGKEKRKDSMSKAGLLGVEGIDADTLRSLFAPYSKEEETEERELIKKSDLYILGLTGREDSKRKRLALCKEASLPSNLSANAMLDALNLMYSKDDLYNLVEKINETY